MIKENIIIKKDTLEALLKVAKIQSTSSSNKIEGIYTSDKRINEIVNQKLEPKNRNEEEIAGYRDVLTLIHENYNFIDINQNTILQLHRDLYKYTGYSYGGKFKNSQNFIEEENEKGEKGGQKLQAKAGQGLFVALMLFVGIPLPGTGAWTGTLAASILDMDFKKTVTAVICGIALAAVIVSVVSALGFGAYVGITG